MMRTRMRTSNGVSKINTRFSGPRFNARLLVSY